MNNRLNDDELNNVVGGAYKENEDKGECFGYFHQNCKGKLKNVGQFFDDVVCAKCGETHFLRTSFAHYTITKLYTGGYKIEYYDKICTDHYDTRPEELDWACNQF